jgi:hypothetical protein
MLESRVLELNGDEVNMGAACNQVVLHQRDGLFELQGNLPPFPRGMLADRWMEGREANEF